MTIYEKKEVKTIKEVGIEIKCDICKKTIAKHGIKPQYYYMVTTGHHEWGNDSIDSVQHQDICSDSCLQVAFNNYLEQVESYDTAYFDVDREYGRVHNE